MYESDQKNMLPTPFFEDAWPARLKPHAQALWNWHFALKIPLAPALDGEDLAAYFRFQREKVEKGDNVEVVPADIYEAAYQTCKEHRLPRSLLARQVMAAKQFSGPVRFSTSRNVTAFINEWARPHGHLLAHLAGVSGSWQLPSVEELSSAFFWVGVLINLTTDLESDRLFIPESDLEQTGVSLEQLREGAVNENMRRLLWKQTVRARDAFAQSEKLVYDLPRRYANAVKKWWMAGLEILNEIQRRDYDVWTRPITLSLYYRILVRMLARFGRTTFRGR